MVTDNNPDNNPEKTPEKTSETGEPAAREKGTDASSDDRGGRRQASEQEVTSSNQTLVPARFPIAKTHCATKRPIHDFLACLSLAGISLRRNELGGQREIKFGDKGWKDFRSDTDGAIHYLIQQRVMLKPPGKKEKPEPAKFAKNVRFEGYDAHFSMEKNLYHPTREYLNKLSPKLCPDVGRGMLEIFTVDPDDELTDELKKHLPLYAEHWLLSLVLACLLYTSDAADE